MNVLSYNTSSKKLTMTATFDEFTAPGISSDINIYHVKFKEKMELYISQLILDLSSAIENIRADYELNQIFKVSDTIKFSVKNTIDESIMEVYYDGTGFVVKVMSELVATYLKTTDIEITGTATSKQINVDKAIKLQDVSSDVYFEVTPTGIKFKNGTTTVNIMVINGSSGSVTFEDLKVSNNMFIDGTLAASKIVVPEIVTIDSAGSTFYKKASFLGGVYFGSVEDGNKLATVKIVEDMYKTVNEKISNFESLLSSYFETLNMPSAKINYYASIARSDSTPISLYKIGDVSTPIATILMPGTAYVDSSSPNVEITIPTPDAVKDCYIKSFVFDFSALSNGSKSIKIKKATAYSYISSAGIASLSAINDVSSSILSSMIINNTGTTDKMVINVDVASAVHPGLGRIKMYVTIKDMSDREFDTIIDLKVGY